MRYLVRNNKNKEVHASWIYWLRPEELFKLCFLPILLYILELNMRKDNKKLVHFNIHNLLRPEIFLGSGGDKGNYVELSSLFFETFIRQHYLPFS